MSHCPTLDFNIAVGEKVTLHHDVHPRLSAGALLLTSSLTYAAYNVGRHPVGDSRLETASGNPHSSEKPVGWGFELSDWGTLGRDRSELCSNVLNSGTSHDVLAPIGRAAGLSRDECFWLNCSELSRVISLFMPCGIASAWYREVKFRIFIR